MKRLKDVNWNQVYYFYEVAKRLSMKLAARHLGVSLPTVSEQIRRLEEGLGVALFRREARRLALSVDGQRLFACARDMFDAGYRFVDAVSPEVVGGYAVRVGLQETILGVAVNFVASYWDRFAPFGTVNTVRELVGERLVERVLKGELDWVVTLAPPKSTAVEFCEIGAFEIRFCCASDLYPLFRRQEDIIRALPLARNGWDRLLNEAVDDRLRQVGVYPREIIESDHRELCRALAQRGRCVATFAEETMKTNGWGLNLTSFRLGDPVTLRFYAIWAKANQKTIAIRKLVETISNPTSLAELDPRLQLKVSGIPPEWLVGSGVELA